MADPAETGVYRRIRAASRLNKLYAWRSSGKQMALLCPTPIALSPDVLGIGSWWWCSAVHLLVSRPNTTPLGGGSPTPDSTPESPIQVVARELCFTALYNGPLFQASWYASS